MGARSRQPDAHATRRVELLGVFVANALPLVGVVGFGWSIPSLLLLYWFELGVDAFWALVRMVIAGRPPAVDSNGLLIGPLAARQPTVAVPGTDLEIYLLTVVGLPILLPLVGVAWLFTGGVLVGPLADLRSATIGSVTAVALGIFFATGITTVRTYVLTGAYRDHNARTAFGGLLWKLVIVFFTGLFTVTFTTAATVGPEAEIAAVEPSAVGVPLLIVVVGLKFTSEYLSVYRDRLAVYFRAYDRQYGWHQPPPTPTQTDDMLAEPTRTVRPHRWGRRLGGPLRITDHRGIALLGVAGLFVAGVVGLDGQWSVATGLAGLTLGGVVGLLCLDQYLRYGSVTYRVGADQAALVAYDRRFEIPLWRLEADDIDDLQRERTVVDNLLDTVTLRLVHGEDEYTLPHLAEPAPVLAVVDDRTTPTG